MASFRKRNVHKPIPGTRTSPQTGQVITSSGNPSLDVILGGGLPIGSICLIEEDKYVSYSKVLAKYFLAEGILSRQSVFLGSLDDKPAELLHKLPKALDEEEVEKEKSAEEKEQQSSELAKNGLRIAWRYNDLPLVNSEQSNVKIGHHFNLMEQMDPILLENAEIFTWSSALLDHDIVEGGHDEAAESDEALVNEVNSENDITYVMNSSKDVDLENVKNSSLATTPTLDAPSTPENNMVTPPTESPSSPVTASLSPLHANGAEPHLFKNSKYFQILKKIHQVLREEKFNAGGFPAQKSLCRLCITSLASPLWYEEDFGTDLLKFLTILRAVVRSSVSVCFITMPMHLVAKYDEALVSKIRNLVDYAIELESFAGSDRETNPAFKEYHGLLQLRKITAVNTLSAYMPETTDLAFKLRRKKFVIEKLHLPPELQEDNEANGRSSGQETEMPTVSCGNSVSSGAKASLDF